MIFVEDFLNLLDANDHDIVIYDENVTDADAENWGDLLYDSSVDAKIPRGVLLMRVASFDLEESILRIWAKGEGVPNRYGAKI